MAHPSTKPQPKPCTTGMKPEVIVEAIELPDGRLIEVNSLLKSARRSYVTSKKSHNLLTLVNRDSSIKDHRKPRHPSWSIEDCQRIYQLYREGDYYQICREYKLPTIEQAKQLASRARSKLRNAGLIGFLPRGPQKRSQ